jgi:N-acetylmuramoyl-L-alanine amidase
LPFSPRQRSLRGKTIAIDAGHGGSADGAVGPLGTLEKDVTLRWANLLAAELKRKGALPILTRTADVDISLPERVAIARERHADFFVSLHANALPDGEDPFQKHGTGTYYYQSLSQRAASMLHGQMLNASGLANDGLYDANFAVVRPTSFPAVLLEAAYIMYPPEEELLRSDRYLRKLSQGVVRGLSEYFRIQP